MEVVTRIAMASLVFFSLTGIFFIIRNYVSDSIGELRFMLKCAKERREMLNQLDASEETEKINRMKEAEDQEICRLEKAIQNHWGRRIASKKAYAFSRLDISDWKHFRL